ncbi:hypothetical protein A3K86_10135 [Photobacterium jeanii]|uniref:MSHA biogenesis protein MshP n=1 Tax=Photobacterium jeanii TaxID=858640 RepID=A0A178KH23_9GAMM|nr:MSHA biogenesis protein MshP [Photobacterium jeanii]OAN16521.1 hypothetical protein A3K86_10135 [Photobacterium jeanii]
MFHKQQGSTLVIVLFVLTAMAVMAVGMVKLNWSQSDTTAKEVLSTRAWFAANSGNEVGLAKLFPLGDEVKAVGCKTAFGATEKLSLNMIAGCSIQVTCDEYKVSGAMTTYQLTSMATCGSNKNQVSRIQETWAKDITEY